jgi:hypothetical protein
MTNKNDVWRVSGLLRLVLTLAWPNLIAALACVLAGCASANSQTAQTPPTYKMTTPIPADITTPDSVGTSLGTLKFFDGFPDDSTVNKVYDNLDSQRSVQAYLTGLPAVSVEAFRRGLDASFGPANQTAIVSETLMDSKSLGLTGNNNTPYVFLWMDTKGGPLVLELPPGVLGMLDDSWQRWDSDLGFTGPDKGKGGKYLLLPPDYKGDVPNGYFVVHSRTFGHWIFLRTFLKDGDPKPGVEAVKKNLRVYPLAKAAEPPKMNILDFSGKAFNTINPTDFSFFEFLNHVIQEEPSDAIDPDTLGVFASIGIEKGKPFAPDGRMKKILTDAAAVGNATARTLAFRSRIKEAFFYPNSAWCNPWVGGSYQFEQNGVRLLDAKTWYFFIAIGISSAMSEKMVGQGSQYAWAAVDAQGNPLDGSKTYKVHLPPNIPVKDFWSFILYDNQTRAQLQTDQRFPMVSSQTKGLVINDDKSVDVYFGPKAPVGKENNWAQTVPGKGWNVLPAPLRAARTVVRQDVAPG